MKDKIFDNKLYYIVGNNLETSLNLFKKYKDEFKDLKFIICLPLENCKEKFLEIYKKLKEEKIPPHSIAVNLIEKDTTFKKEELKQIQELDEFFKKRQITFGIEDLYKIFPAQNIITAHKKINNTANIIKKQKYSPLEKLLDTYLKVTYRKYIQEDKTVESPANSRSIYGVLNSNKIVCVGFSRLLFEVIHNIDDDNIKIYKNSVMTAEENEKPSYHSNIIVHIKDEKYKLNGYYYLDPTWNDGHLNKYVPELSYFLVPLCDIKHIKTPIVKHFEITKPIKQSHKPKIVKRTITINKPKNMPSVTYFSSNAFTFHYKFLEDFKKLYPKFYKNLMKKYNLEEKELDKKLVEEEHFKDDIYNFFIKNSKPIDMHRLAFCLKNVLKVKFPKLNEQELYNKVKRYMEYNCMIAKEDFKEDAKNAFIQYGKIFENEDDFVL